MRKHPALALDLPAQPCRNGCAEHWGKQVNPQKPRLPRSGSRSELAGRIQAATARCSEQRNPQPYEPADDPRHKWRQPLYRETDSDKEHDDSHTQGLGCE
jgi:hypothetical protein